MVEMLNGGSTLKRKWQWSGIITNPNRKNGYRDCTRYKQSTASLARASSAKKGNLLSVFVVINIRALFWTGCL